MKICFLGGSFDPPHIGHLKIAFECLKQCQKFVFIPSKHSPHKESLPYFSSIHRLKMLDILTSEYKNIEVDPFEINSDSEVSYTIDTIKYLSEKYKNACIYMVVGSDLINNIHLWKEWSQIKKKVNVICFKRFGYEDINFNDEDILFLNSVNLDVSSSSVKEEIFANRLNTFANFSNMISKDIYDYICKNKLNIKQS